MESTTIRIHVHTRDQLNELARRRGATAGQVVAELVAEADDRALLEEAARGWDALGEDPRALKAYRAEASDIEAFDAELPEY